jgi:hypothetical protein
MEKLIIENRTSMPMDDALEYVRSVIIKGKISKTSKGEQYCFAVAWPNGVRVFADKNKCSDRLIVTDE